MCGVANGLGIDCHGSQVLDERLPDSDALLWYCECRCQWSGHVEVSTAQISSDLGFEMLMRYSSVVLWVSQNIEDDYTYNLAL